ncbi:MAG: hypothetical protein IT338_13845 [Thermomicrobiales bacterium]|nr:hypothetical protein [Thermomicrobiales bacterium]
MVTIILSLAEWQAVLHELAAAHTEPAPPGLQERVRDLVARSPKAWPTQHFALELDESCAEAVQRVHGAIVRRDPATGQRDASVAEAMRIIRDHQQRL